MDSDLRDLGGDKMKNEEVAKKIYNNSRSETHTGGLDGSLIIIGIEMALNAKDSALSKAQELWIEAVDKGLAFEKELSKAKEEIENLRIANITMEQAWLNNEVNADLQSQLSQAKEEYKALRQNYDDGVRELSDAKKAVERLKISFSFAENISINLVKKELSEAKEEIKRVKTIEKDWLEHDCGKLLTDFKALKEEVESLKRKETHLYDIYHSLGLKWGDNPFSAINKLLASKELVRKCVESLTWITHLVNGVSKSGGNDISSQEWEECNKECQEALTLAKESGIQ